MRRTLWIASPVLALALAAICLFKPSPSPAGAGKSDPAGIPPSRSPFAQLPIARVVLFSSGVGYFQREGEVDGNTRIDLSFPVQDINDLLKSMVLRDLNGGQISAVSYDSHDPIDKTLQSFAVNLTNNPGYGQILNQARGEKVEVVLQQGNVNQPGTLNGAIIGIERQKQQAGKDGALEIEMLNLWCGDGMRSVRLTNVQRVHFLNPVMDSEFKRALNVLVMSHDAQKKSVSLSFTGDGKRQVRVGYVVQNPIWKTSYRLVLGKDNKPFLQGWAVVENPSDEDWNNVRMALVSGRPISFQMNLYQPLYVPRPLVEPELFASLRPQTYGGGMGMMGAMAGAPPANAPAPSSPMNDSSIAVPGFGLAKPGKTELKMELRKGLNDADALQVNEFGLPGVASAATARDLGDYFEYNMDNPVNLPRQKSALLPIVNKDIEGTKVSIYNESTHNKFPLFGLKFKNTTGLHLMQGPITVFEGNSYAGDARILDLQPKEERLISYAIDLGTEVEPVAKSEPERLIAVKINKGILLATHKLRQKKTYNVKNRSEHDRTLIVEHPFRPDFKLVSQEKPAEKTREVYRFELSVPAGKMARQEVMEEQDLVRQVILTNADDQNLRIFLSSQVSSDQVKDALKKATELRNRMADTQREMAQVKTQLQAITEDQTRLRANLKEMPQTAPAYKRYLEKFDKQETEIERLQEQTKKLQQAEQQERKEYEGYLSGLNVE